MNEWKSFKEIIPRDYCGVLIIIKGENEFYDVKDHLFYGYIENEYIFIIFDITTQISMLWKVQKEFNDDQIFWYYYNAFKI